MSPRNERLKAGVRSFKRYTAYKESGVEWLGETPEHWDVVRSKRLFALRNKKATPTDRQLTASQEYGVIPQDEFMARQGRRVVQVFTGHDILKHVELNDFVISMRSFQGGIELSKARGAISSAYVVLSPSAHVDHAYFSYLLKSVRYIQALQSTSDLVRDGQALRFENFCLVDLPILPLEEQRAIAALLDRETAKIDALVAKKERLIELLHEKRTALITRAVTKGLDPKAPMKASGVEWLGEIPEHWDAAKMWRISSAQGGGTPAKDEPAYWDGGIPWVSPKDMKRRFICASEDTVTERAVKESSIGLIAPPVVLIVVRGMILVHTFPVAITTAPVTINQDMKALRFRPNINPNFMAWLFEGIGKSLLTAVVEEAAHGTRAIRMDEWRSVKVPVPAEGEQRDIAVFLDRETAKIDDLGAKVGQAIDRLKELRTALISAAVTGKIDVRSEVEEVA